MGILLRCVPEHPQDGFSVLPQSFGHGLAVAQQDGHVVTQIRQAVMEGVQVSPIPGREGQPVCQLVMEFRPV